MHVKLLVVHGRPQGKALSFPPGEYVFGRGAECHVRPNSEMVSRQHCMLRVADDALFIRDLGSRNGTLVNGERVRGERRLEHRDLLQVGPVVFEVSLEEVPLPREPAPADAGETRILKEDTVTGPVLTPDGASPGRPDESTVYNLTKPAPPSPPAQGDPNPGRR